MKIEQTEKYAGKMIAEKRKALGWSQDELAKKMGYTSRSTINKIELGKNSITTIKAEKFAKVLDCPVKEFFPDEIFERDELCDAILNNKQLAEALKIFLKLTDEKQQSIINLIQAFGKNI